MTQIVSASYIGNDYYLLLAEGGRKNTSLLGDK
jgi:hypothetical protein